MKLKCTIIITKQESELIGHLGYLLLLFFFFFFLGGVFQLRFFVFF
jgi:hypothetical protein